MSEEHTPYQTEEPPLELLRNEQVLREYLNRELKRIANAFNGVDLAPEPRWQQLYVPQADHGAIMGYGTTGTARATAVLPPQYKTATNIRVGVHWRRLTVTSGTAVAQVNLLLRAWRQNVDATLGASSDYSMTATAGPGNVMRLSKAELTITALTNDAMLFFQVFRRPDTLSADVEIQGITVRYQAGSHGTYKEGQK